MKNTKTILKERKKEGVIGLNYDLSEIILKDLTPLAEHYGRKTRNEDVKSDLILFIWGLISSGKALSRRYMAVAVRNEYIRLSKKLSEQRNFENEIHPNLKAESEDIDIKIDIRDALKKLSPKQRDAVILHRVSGLGFAELAELHGTTRQGEYQLERRAEKKLCEIIKNK